MGRVLGYDPIGIGVAFLPLEASLIIASVLATRLINRIGYAWVMFGGLLITAAGLLWFARVPVEPDYIPDVIGPLILFGAGLGIGFVATYIVCQDGVPPALSGLASGLVNVTQNVGGAIGLAVLGALAAARTGNLSDKSHEAALTSGLHVGWAGAAVCVIFAALLALALIKPRRDYTVWVESRAGGATADIVSVRSETHPEPEGSQVSSQ